MAFHLRKAVLGAVAPHREREQHKGLVKQNPTSACRLWAVPSGAHRELLHVAVFQCFAFGNRAGRWFWNMSHPSAENPTAPSSAATAAPPPHRELKHAKL